MSLLSRILESIEKVKFMEFDKYLLLEKGLKNVFIRDELEIFVETFKTSKSKSGEVKLLIGKSGSGTSGKAIIH